MKGGLDTGKLDLIVTHYRSPWSLGKPLFDMVAAQRNVDFNEVGVILVNDGEESRLPDELFAEYPFRVTNLTIPHGGVSRARNAGLDESDAEWVMLCDFDDQFSMVTALQIIFSAIEDWGKDADLFWCPFLEELKVPDGSIKLVTHGDDYVFIHGKVFNRNFLVENNIRFCDRLTLHEDVFFVKIARITAKEERQRKIPASYWLWCWNPDSVGRKYGDDFMLHTYDHLMKQRCEMVEEHLRRGQRDDAVVSVAKTVVDAYYDAQLAVWKKQKDWYDRFERWFCGFFKLYAKMYAECDVRMTAALAAGSRENRIKEGTFLMETVTMGDWLKHIMNDVEPVSREELFG